MSKDIDNQLTPNMMKELDDALAVEYCKLGRCVFEHGELSRNLQALEQEIQQIQIEIEKIKTKR